MRVAVFGGSFNPIHTGHALIASSVAESGEADEVWLMVSPQNPLKQDRMLMPEIVRFRLAAKVTEMCKGVKASDFEFHLPRPSYTYNTLCKLKENFPEDQFILLIGSDNWKIFDKWMNSDKIISEFGVLIYQRPDDPATGPFPEGVKVIDNVPQMLVSSTLIRERLKKGKDIRFLVPDVIYNEVKSIFNEQQLT